MIYLRVDIKEIESKIDFIKDNNLGAEITLYDTEYLNKVSFYEIYEKAKLIEEKNIEIITHLPMYGTNIGIKDSVIQEYSLNITLKALDISRTFGAQKAVFHNGLNPLEPYNPRMKWYETFKINFDKIIEAARIANIQIVTENVWDYDDEFFKFIKDNYSDVKFCYDIGHSKIYLRGIEHEKFIREYADYISHIHVHDNHLKEDEHLHIGEGIIDFENYFAHFNKYLNNLTYTLETKIDDKILEDVNKILYMTGGKNGTKEKV